MSTWRFLRFGFAMGIEEGKLLWRGTEAVGTDRQAADTDAPEKTSEKQFVQEWKHFNLPLCWCGQ